MIYNNYISLEVILDGNENIDQNKPNEPTYTYFSNEQIKGKVLINLRQEKFAYNHNGISITLYGEISTFDDQYTYSPFMHEFISLDVAGTISKSVEYPFEFPIIKKFFESYEGANVKVKNTLLVCVDKTHSSLSLNIPLRFKSLGDISACTSTRMLEIGLKNSLLLEIELNKTKYSINDAIVGRVTFLMLNVELERMEMSIERHEFIANQYNSTSPNMEDVKEILKIELLDGNPNVGDTIPFRIFLKDLINYPTIDNLDDKLSVKYYVVFASFDQAKRRYFKKDEIYFYRSLTE